MDIKCLKHFSIFTITNLFGKTPKFKEQESSGELMCAE
ncbi:hypothetical protein D778_02126 [Xanthomarina gelatinilytica]|uniref:Uncharacterized protein n=1 Tax=Xanthomarina gelatinilytica TaxID=1137281 RepID=M7MMH0_9FLAO|nr:hypothetical protein D778_02126 [Xanthomarina gelatinilytica]